jgi:RNA polymerase primary sigma factor
MDMTKQADDAVKAYLSEIGSIPPLSKAEESQLWQQRKNEDKIQAELATRRLLESKLRLVVTIAERHSSSGISMLDLIQEGNIGLLAAVDTFAQSASDDFSAYAATCIENAIAKAIAEPQSE